MNRLKSVVAFLDYHRRAVAAVCAALCMFGLIQVIQTPPDSGSPIIAAAADLPAGHVLSEEDLTAVNAPDALVLPHSVRDASKLVGATTLVAIDKGQPISEHDALTGTPSPNMSLVPVAVANDDVRAMLIPGQKVTLIVALDGAPEVVTEQARIMRLPAPAGGGLGAARESQSVLVEVPNAVAGVVATLGQSGQLGFILATT